MHWGARGGGTDGRKKRERRADPRSIEKGTVGRVSSASVGCMILCLSPSFPINSPGSGLPHRINSPHAILRSSAHVCDQSFMLPLRRERKSRSTPPAPDRHSPKWLRAQVWPALGFEPGGPEVTSAGALPTGLVWDGGLSHGEDPMRKGLHNKPCICFTKRRPIPQPGSALAVTTACSRQPFKNEGLQKGFPWNLPSETPCNPSSIRI